MSQIDITQLNLLYRCSKELLILGKTNGKAPRILDGQIDIPEIVLNDVNIKCSFEGALPANVTWYKDDKPLSEIHRKNGFQFTKQKTILRIKELMLSDGGKYRCVVENVFGKAVKLFTVEPLEKTLSAPIFVSPVVRNQYARSGSDLNVTVDAVVFSTAHFQLLHHLNQTDPITQKTEATLKIMTIPRVITLIGPETHKKSSDAFRYRLTFMFKDMTESDFGSYSIMAGNTVGYSVTQFILIKRD